jgi:uncharacterized membrane protein YdfJ with MMPL/SSD domain
MHRGVVNTGHIITAAGVIMAVAFSGLLFSSEVRWLIWLVGWLVH